MAAHRSSGESHNSRSTPAVRLPWFSVTRLTADALAENERVSIRCKAFTLRHLRPCVAFAIRICIPLTFRSTRRQLISPHRCGTPESADLTLRLGSLMLLSFLKKMKIPQMKSAAFPLRRKTALPQGKHSLCVRWLAPSFTAGCRGLTNRLATKDQLEVCPLSRGVMFQPLSEPLQPGVRFLQPPIPAQPTASLAVRLPEPYCTPAAIRAYHVPYTLHDRVRACLFAGGLKATYPELPAG